MVIGNSAIFFAPPCVESRWPFTKILIRARSQFWCVTAKLNDMFIAQHRPSSKQEVLCHAERSEATAFGFRCLRGRLWRVIVRGSYYVYILASRSRTLYTGVANNIHRRVGEHKAGSASRFTAKYKINRLVYYEEFKYIDRAIAREKVIKGWLRSRKVALIESANPTWEDLSAGWTFESPFAPAGVTADPSLRSG